MLDSLTIFCNVEHDKRNWVNGRVLWYITKKETKMRALMQVILFFIVVILIGCSSTSPDSDQIIGPPAKGFGITNNTDATIHSVYIKLPSSNDWGYDILPHTLPSGSYFSVILSEPLSSNNRYDIRLMSYDSTHGVYTKVNTKISKDGTVTFTNSDKNPIFTVVNNTNTTISEVSVKPTEDEYWYNSHDFSGDKQMIQLLDFSPSNRYDIRIVGVNSTVFTKRNMQITKETNINFTISDKNPTITILNKTEKPFHYYSIKDTDKEYWSYYQQNLGEQNQFQIIDFSVSNRYDLVLENVEGIKYSKSNLLIDRHTDITISQQDKNPIITITNNTGFIITAFAFKKAEEAQGILNNWYDIENGGSTQYHIFDKSPSNRYDIILYRRSGVTYPKLNTLITQDTNIIFTANDRDKSNPVVTIFNGTGIGINRIFIRQSGTSNWGYSFIYSLLSNNSSTEIQLQSVNQTNRYDIRLQLSNNSFIEFVKSNILIENDIIVNFTDDNSNLEEVILFYSDFETGNDGWTIVNGSETNKWHRGTDTSYYGNSSIYISDNNGVSNSYYIYSRSRVHFYRNITIPESAIAATLSFVSKYVGESGYDYLTVSQGSYVPFAGESGGVFDILRVPISSIWTESTVNLTEFYYNYGSSFYLIFTWVNDSSDGTNPPAAVDDIIIRYYLPKQ